MRKVIVAFAILFFMSGCSRKVIYLSSWGTITGIYNDYIEVRFNCENVRRPDCDAIAKFDRSKFGNDIVLFQRLEICNWNGK